MKILSSLFITFCAFNYYSQTSCFTSEDDVMLYVIDKTFESKDGQISIKFNTSQATLKAGSSSFNYMYDKFSYGSGYKGVIEMTELSGEGGLKMYVSCKEKMMTDNKGTFLYEGSANGNIKSTVKIGKTIKIEPTYKTLNLEVMEEDLGKMSWDQALIACSNLGDGWKLPTKDELLVIYQNKDLVGGFNSKRYWSSTPDEDNSEMAYDISFLMGNGLFNFKRTENYVRAVKSYGNYLKATVKNDKTVKIGKLVFQDLSEISFVTNDGYYEYLNFEDAKKLVSSYGKGWRLPSSSELRIISDNISLFNSNGSYLRIWGSQIRYEEINRGNAVECLTTYDNKREIGYDPVSSLDPHIIIVVRDMTAEEIKTTEKIEQENIGKAKLEASENEKKRRQAELEAANEMRLKGTNDSKINYKGKKSGTAWTTVTTLLFSPIVGVIPAAVCGSKEPSYKNLNYPNDELMKNKDYKEEYIKKAHKTKKKKVWISYATSSAAWIIIILLL